MQLTVWILLVLLLAGALPADAAETRRISSSKVTSSDASGVKYALLVGINDYPTAPLNGTLNDVAVWKDALTNRYGFPSGNVTTLLDRQATKANILRELNRLEQETKPGDTVFFFFSGHGTSSYDPEVKLDMGPATGALVPVDAKLTGSRNALLESLLVGRRDLRPLFEKMDQDRQVIVVVDACYSGNTVRSLSRNSQPGSRGIPKYLPLTALQGSSPPPSPTSSSVGKAAEPYPYRNVLYISAADDREKAQDLSSDHYDGKPHGALTGALMRGMRGDADSNNDGVVSYSELYQFARKETQQHGHTPQLLADTSFDRTRRIFNAKPALKKDQRSAFSAKAELRLRLDGSAASLVGQLKGMAGLKLSDGDYDLLVTSENGEYLLSMSNGDLVTKMNSSKEVKQRVERYLAVRELVGLSNPAAKFNVSLVVGADEGKSVFLNGEQISFQVRSEADVSLLLLDIDPQGYISVVFPARPTDNTRIERGALRTLGETGTVSEPLGVEILKLFAFAKPVEALKHFAGKSPIDPMGREFAELLQIIKQNSPKGSGWAEATVEVVTTKGQ